MTATRKSRNWALSCGVSPGLSRLLPASSASDQLRCLPDPLTPANGFSCKQELEAVAVGHALHGLHHQHVVVGGDVGVLERHGQLVLGRRDLVVPGLDRHAQLVKLGLGLEHAGQDALRDGAEVMVLHLLALGRLGAEERPAGVDQVGPGEVEVLVDQEVLLLGPGRAVDARGVRAEEPEDPHGLLREGFHRAEQGGLLVEGLAGPGTERGGDAQGRAVGVVEDERGAGRVPGGIAAGLEGGADAARGEARGVGLAANQLLAAELGDRRARLGRDQERVVLLGGQPGHRLEPVGEMGRAVFHGPLPHRGRDDVGDRRIERSTFLDRVPEGLVDVLRQPRLHDFVGEDVDAEKLANRRRQPRGSPAGCRPGGDRLMAESRARVGCMAFLH